MPDALALGLALAAGAVLQSAVGFGAGLLAAPLLTLVFEPVEVVWLLLLSALVLGPLILAEPDGRGRVERVDTAWLVAWAIPAMPLGAVVVHALGREAMQVLIGVVVLAFLALPRIHSAAPGGRVGRAAAGAGAGFMTTATSLNGPPLVLWMRGRYGEPTVFRATITAAFLAIDAIGLLILVVAGVPSLSATELAAALVGTAAGWLLGRGLFRRMRPEQHRSAVTVVLVVAALASLVAGLA